MRERGVQSRRARDDAERIRRSAPPGRSGGNPGLWQGLAIVALIAATAGWTTVAVLALRPQETAVATPSDTADTGDTADSPEPIVPSHTVPALEALLPTEVSGTTLVTESWTGDQKLEDDPMSQTLTGYLGDIGKTQVDLQLAQAYDPLTNSDQTSASDQNTGLDLSIGVFRVVGSTDAVGLRNNLIKAWQDAVPDLKVSSATIGGKGVVKGDFGPDAVDSYWYITNGVVYDVETTDETLAAAALTKLPAQSGSPAPPYVPPPTPKPSTAPASSSTPTASPS